MIKNNKHLTIIVSAIAGIGIVTTSASLWALAPPLDESAQWRQHISQNARKDARKEDISPSSVVGNVYSSTRDSELNLAVSQARLSQLSFENAFRAGEAGRYSFKILLSDGLKSEPLWVRLTDIIGSDYQGEIGKIPESLAFASQDKTVRIPSTDIVDWMIQREDGIYGAYTTRVLLRRSADPNADVILDRIKDF